MICEPSRPEGPLVISNIQADSVHLAWKPPLEDYSGPILGYVIEAKDVLHMDVRKINFWSEGQNTEYVVKGLETSHIYQFRVYAQNVAGKSEGLLNKTLVRIKAVTKKPPTPSKPSVEIHSNDSIYLQWATPSADGDLNYIIERFEPKYDMWLQCNKGIVTRTSYLVAGLTVNREYKFRISSENVHGVSKPSCETEAISIVEKESDQPRINIPIKDCFVEENGSAVFVCEFAGTPPIEVKWMKDGLRIRESLTATIKTEGNLKSELKLLGVESDDDDVVIRCVMKNSAGEETSEAKIKILRPPQLSCPKSYKEGLTYDTGDTLKIRITVTGAPPPQMTCSFNENVLSSSSDYETIHDNELFELKRKDIDRNHSGIYKFIAINEVGEDDLTVSVSVSGLPDPIKDSLIFDTDEEEGVVLKWNPPLYDGGSDIFNYIVEKRMGENVNWFQLVTSRNKYLNLGTVEETEGCYFRVKCVNVFGISSPSEEKKYSRVINMTAYKENKPGFSEEACDETKTMAPEEIKYSIEECDLNTCSSKTFNAKLINPIIPNNNEPSTPNTLICNATENLFDIFEECFPLTIENIKHDKGSCTMNNTDFSITFVDVVSFEETAERSLLKQPSFNCTSQWNLIEHSIDVFQIFGTINLTQEHFEIDKINNRFNWLILPPISSLSNDFVVSQTECAKCFDEEHVNYIVVSQQIVLEMCPSFQSHLNFLQVLTTWDYFTPIFIEERYVFENSDGFKVDHLTQCCNAYPIVHAADDFETLATLNPIPLMNCKLALSVLPIKEVCRQMPKKSPMFTPVAKNRSEVIDESNVASHIINESYKRKSTHEVSKELKKSYLKKLESDDIFENNNALKSTKLAVFEKSVLNFVDTDNSKLIFPDTSIYIDEEDAKFDIDDLLCDYREYCAPNWLPFISPSSSVPETFSVKEGEINGFDSKEDDHSLLKEKTVSLKGKTFEELLNIAEQVEKSFSQKAQQIESLENILHEELDSLEKDLQTFHQINQSLSGDFIAKDASLTNEVENIIRVTDLIDFTEDVSDLRVECPKLEFYPPTVITHLQNKVVQRGSRARLYCSITGDPAPDVVWLKNGKLLQEKSRYIFNDLMEFGFYVDIYSVKSTDSGQYGCLATNDYGSVQTEAYLQVIGEREDSPVEPKFLDCPDDLTVNEGEMVSLEWKITGTPFPNAIWFKNAEKIETSLHIDVFSNYKGTCRLTIHKTDESDSAIYSCYLENEIGSTVSTVLLSVKESKSFQVMDPSKSEAESEISVDWSSQSSSTHESHTFDAIMPKPRIPTDQVKAASNIPGPPCTPSIFSVGRTWVMLSWSPPLSHLSKKSSLTYLIESRLLNSSHWKEVGKTRNTIHTAHGFKCKRSYVFRVSAGNGNGWGRPAVLSQPVYFI